MLVGGIVRFFISLLVSNWIYSEIVFFCPSFDKFAKSVYQTAKIPTHDKWGDIVSDGSADRLGRDIERSISTVSPGAAQSFSGFFDVQIRDLWNSGALRPIRNLIGGDPFQSPIGSTPFLSGEDIFSHRTIAKIRHARF